MTLIISVPIGVAAIYLVEYAKRVFKTCKNHKRKLQLKHWQAYLSIVFGLFGFCICSCLTLGIFINSRSLTPSKSMVLPTIIRTTEEAAIAVPDSFREGSFGLGCRKLRTIFVIVCYSSSGCSSRVILAIGRIIVVKECSTYYFYGRFVVTL